MLKLWDPSSGEELRTFRDPSGAVHGIANGCAVAPDGSYVVSAGGVLTLWDPSTGQELRTLQEYDAETSTLEGCAVAPDGSYVVSAGGYDQTLKVWDPSTGLEVGTIPLLGELDCVALHPWLPLAVCGDGGGSLYLIELVGIEYGPIIVTAVQRDGLATVRCPKCWQAHPLNTEWLGQLMDCPSPTCDLTLRVNPFIAGQSSIHDLPSR